MSEEQNKLSDFNDLIREKMGELIDLRSNTWKWLATEHTVKDTEARLNEARTISEELSQIAHGLVDHKKPYLLMQRRSTLPSRYLIWCVGMSVRFMNA